MTVILSVDVEDWAQTTLDTELPVTDRAERNTHYLLDVMADAGRQMTCFVLGNYAEKFPASVRRIAEEGHEVASHGYGHVNVFLQSRDEFRQDVARSKAQLEDLTGQPVRGYRAPNFSMGQAGDWPLEVLGELGFEYDASLFPSATYRHGRAGWPTHPVAVELSSGRRILEFPAATRRFLGREWPVAGGGYFRLLPWPLIEKVIDGLVRENGAFTTYCHPYEFDPDEFAEMDDPPGLKMRLHQGLGRRGFERKFRNIMRRFETITAAEGCRRLDFPSYPLPGARGNVEAQNALPE